MFHIAVRRIFKPESHIISLFMVFVFIPVPLLLAGFGILSVLQIGLLSIDNFLLILLLYLAVSGVYIQTYPAIQAWSPSLLMTYIIGKNKQPISIDEIRKMINRENLIKDKIYELENEGLINICPKDNSICLTAWGRLLSGIFLSYRKIIRLEEGKG